MPKIVHASTLMFVLFKAFVAFLVFCWALNVSAAVWSFGWHELVVYLIAGTWCIGVYVGYNVRAS